MSVSTQDIQNKKFSTKFRGFDAGEVEDFLKEMAESFLSMKNENEKLIEQIKHLQISKEQSEKNEQKYKISYITTKKAAEEAQEKLRQEANIRVKRVCEDIEQKLQREANAQMLKARQGLEEKFYRETEEKKDRLREEMEEEIRREMDVHAAKAKEEIKIQLKDLAEAVEKKRPELEDLIAQETKIKQELRSLLESCLKHVDGEANGSQINSVFDGQPAENEADGIDFIIDESIFTDLIKEIEYDDSTDGEMSHSREEESDLTECKPEELSEPLDKESRITLEQLSGDLLFSQKKASGEHG